MTKTLYFECNNGISGDMTLGALIHLGADINVITERLRKLGISEFELIPKKHKLNGISGIDLQVIIPDEEDSHNHNSFADIKKMILNSPLNDNTKKYAIDIFTVIAKAESAVHDMSYEDVVFHEVGALDSIIDIVGTAIAVDLLNIDDVQCTSVHDGSGYIECRHGTIPVPVPAVMEMLKKSNIPIVIEEEIKTEMVTPTGFGILEGLKAKHCLKHELKVKSVGYGFGNRQTGKFNAVRIIMGESID